MIRYLVIHCTATESSREVSSGELQKWHTAPVAQGGRGWHQVGYTDMIHLNGGVERLVDNNEDDRVDNFEVTNGAAGYNSQSRHIVYVGGLHKGKPCDTRTASQSEAMLRYVKDFHRRFPNVKIIGHNEISSKACPCFDVQRWLRDNGINNNN